MTIKEIVTYFIIGVAIAAIIILWTEPNKVRECEVGKTHRNGESCMVVIEYTDDKFRK